MAERAAVMIAGLVSHLQVERAFPRQLLQLAQGIVRQGFCGTWRMLHFRRVHPDQSHPAPVGEDESVAVQHFLRLHAFGFGSVRQGAVRRCLNRGSADNQCQARQDQPAENAHKKGSTGSLSVAAKLLAHYFLIEATAPKRFLNLSMRPPVSTTFCWPV